MWGIDQCEGKNSYIWFQKCFVSTGNEGFPLVTFSLRQQSPLSPSSVEFYEISVIPISFHLFRDNHVKINKLWQSYNFYLAYT